jgi:hypothetical protein
MAALSVKAQAGEIVVVDQLIPDNTDARDVFARVLLANMPELKRTGDYKIKNAWVRKAITPHGLQAEMYGELDESGKYIATFYPNEVIVKRLLRNLDEQKVDYAWLLARTGARATGIHHLMLMRQLSTS